MEDLIGRVGKTSQPVELARSGSARNYDRHAEVKAEPLVDRIGGGKVQQVYVIDDFRVLLLSLLLFLGTDEMTVRTLPAVTERDLPLAGCEIRIVVSASFTGGGTLRANPGHAASREDSALRKGVISRRG